LLLDVEPLTFFWADWQSLVQLPFEPEHLRAIASAYDSEPAACEFFLRVSRRGILSDPEL
jgi:hypothetical protein